jgi:acid phosphatase
MISALGLFSDPIDLPVTHIAPDRKWKTSQITPMGGRIIFERLSCSSGDTQAKKFVRFNVNDGIVPMAGCNNGPGSSCPLSRFAEYVKDRGVEAGDFRTVCGLPEDAAPKLTFLRQPGYGGTDI